MSNENQTSMRGAVAWMAGNSVAANLLMLLLLIGGLLIGTNLKQEVFPEFDLDIVTVTVVYPGASPEEVEQGIILAIEDAVQGLDGVKEVTSTAQEGVGRVTVELLLGENLQTLASDIESEVDRITSFPEEAEEPEIAVVSRKREVVTLALYGEQSMRVLHNLGESLRDFLLHDDEITQVELSGVRDLEISIEVPQEQLRRYDLTLEDIANTVRQTSLELPGGGIETDGGEVLVRMTERRDYGRQFHDIPIISAKSGAIVRLGDIARIVDGYDDSDYVATYDGQPAVMLEVYRIGKQTPIGVSQAVQRQLEAWRAEALPNGVGIAVLKDRSEVFTQRADLLMRNAFLGLSLVLILLSVFLEVRLAFWVTMGIPISFLGAFFLLAAHGVSINMVSMFAFIIALGIVVDDAIVVGENIYKMRQSGMPFHRAAVAGVREVAVPVTFSVLTNIVAFLPLYFIPGTMGKIMMVIPVVVVSVFTISLVESVFVLPSHLGHLRANPHEHGLMAWLHRKQQHFSLGFKHMVERWYGPLLNWILHTRYITIACAVAILVVTVAYVSSGRMGMTMFPKVEADYAYVSLTLPYGVPVGQTEAKCRSIVSAAREVARRHGDDKQVEGIFVEVGKEGSHTAAVRVFMTDPKVRPVSTDLFTREWRAQVGPLSGIENISFASDRGGPGSGAAITIELSHLDMGVLEQASEELAAALEHYPKVSDIDDGFAPGKQQLDLTLTEAARSLGLTVRDVAMQIRHAYDGAEVLRQQRGRNEVIVNVIMSEKERETEQSFENMLIRTATGGEIPLLEAVHIKRGRAYIAIDRRNGRRVVTVSADVNPRPMAGQILRSLEQDTLPQLLQRHAGLSYSYEGRQADMAESMQGLVRGLILALMMIYVLLAIPFRSYAQPLIIMISIPFGMIGAICGHILMGYSLSIMSMFGVVALSGVVVNDSLVLIDFANRRRRENGESPHDAVLAAGVMRFRPIMLTTMTTFCGLAPMIFETSRQARFLIPMAISLGFGILFATVIALILVPVLYMVVEDLHDRFRPLKLDSGE